MLAANCPNCGRWLDAPERLLGGVVACGNSRAVFAAEPKGQAGRIREIARVSPGTVCVLGIALCAALGKQRPGGR